MPLDLSEKVEKGLLDFVVLVEQPDTRKYEYIEFPQADTWGLIIPENDQLAKKESIHIDDLIGLPLFCSDQAWNGDIRDWSGSRFSDLQLEGSFRLSYNGSIFAMEGLGYLLTYEHLINTSKDSGLVFRPLSPKHKIYFAWNRYQAFTPIAERFLSHLKALLHHLTFVKQLLSSQCCYTAIYSISKLDAHSFPLLRVLMISPKTFLTNGPAKKICQQSAIGKLNVVV